MTAPSVLPPTQELTSAVMSQLVALLAAGRYAQLERKARELTAEHPSNGSLWKILGVSQKMQAKDALPALQRAAMLLPGDAEAHCNLGIAQMDAGSIDEAVASYRCALQINPNDANAHLHLGNALLDLGRLDEAAASCRWALEIRSDYVEAYISLGNVLRSLGRPVEAVARYCRALAIKPDYAEAHANLGSALWDLGRTDDALASYRRALELKPDLAEARNDLGNLLRGLGRLDEAVAHYRRAIELKPDYAEAHNNMGVALRLQGRAADAEASSRRALEIDPNSATAFAALAEAQADRGEFSAAEELFRRAISMEPNLTEAWVGIARLRKMTADDAPWLAEAQRIAASPLRPREATSLRYAIGKYFDDLQDFDQAFSSYQGANELTKLQGTRYDRQRMTQDIELLMQSFDRDWVNRAAIHGLDSARSVFIVGMPRSGTSLAEQILASHPQVFGAGELTFWNSASASYRTAARERETIGGSLNKLTGDYLRLLQDLSADALRVIDKMPGNFLHLGLIHAALPNARIIHMRRNPIDTCLSIYFQDFDATLSYANDLHDLAHYYGEYLRVMRHWQSVLPAQAILNVPYEGLVEAQEVWSRKMLEFIGLPWDPQCLDFHLTRRGVATVSKWQVRQRINASSVARWRHYQAHIGPLLNLLQLDAGA